MKKRLLLFLGLLGANWLNGQSAAPYVVASEGNHVDAAAFSLDYTVGETVIETLTRDSFTLTQGFHQPNLMLINAVDALPELNVKVYPNPTADWQLSNANGQVILQSKRATTLLSETLDLGNYPAGTYWLSFRTPENRMLKSFQIIKIK